MLILFTISITNAFPIQKYRIFSGIPVFVQLSGKPLSLSHSIGVSTLSLPVCKSVTTREVLPTCVSEVNIVRGGLSLKSEK